MTMLFAIRVFGLWLTATSAACLAGDLSDDVRRGASSHHSGDGGYLEIGYGVVGYTSPFYGFPEGNSRGELHLEGSLDLNARYQYAGFFAEVFSQSLQEFTLGYNLLSTPNLALDLIGTQEHHEISEDYSADLAGLRRRRGDLMFGARATGYHGNYITQAHLLQDVSGAHDGQLFSVKLARHWQIRNWNFHGIVGATYRSTDLMDYYFSISEDEASDLFPVFNARGGMAYVAEIGSTYPISERWVFRGFFRYLTFDSTVTGSGLMIDDHGEIIATAISYVF